MSEDNKPGTPSDFSSWGTFEFGRRQGLKALGVMAASGALATLADVSAAHAATKSGTIKIGFVSPRTGSLADFAGPDAYVISLIKRSSYFAKGITIGKTHYKIWLSDGEQVPVQFSVDDDSGVVTFTLAR